MAKVLELILLVHFWLRIVNAQYGNPHSSGPSTSTSTITATMSATSSATRAIQTIDVGEDGALKYNPDSITVPQGGQVAFQFYPGNHSVVQAAFESPCHPLSKTSLFSGFILGTNNEEKPDIFTVTVNNTDPIWFYCGQDDHCESGMVGVINPPSNGNTLAMFKSAAANANGSTVPATVQGGVFGVPQNGTGPASSSTTSSATATATSSPTTSSATAASSPSASPTSEAQSLRIWTDMSVIFILSVMVASMLFV